MSKKHRRDIIRVKEIAKDLRPEDSHVTARRFAWKAHINGLKILHQRVYRSLTVKAGKA